MRESRLKADPSPLGAAILRHSRVAAAWRAQLARRRTAIASGAGRVGWKLAWGLPAVDEEMDGAPVFGYLTAATQLAGGDAFDASDAADLRVECELAVRVGPIATGATSTVTVTAHAVAIEVVDVGPPSRDIERIITDNVGHRGFVLGPVHDGVPMLPLQSELRVDGAIADRATADRLPVAALAELAAALEGAGEALVRGDWILLGSITHVPVRGGARIDARIVGLDALHLAIAP